MTVSKIKISLFALFLATILFLLPPGVFAAMNEVSPVPPKTAGVFKQSAAPLLVTAENIFEYMNGAGELYLAYRFDRMTLYEYVNAGNELITVEIYAMQSPHDAFGLLSLDWGGAPVTLVKAGRSEQAVPATVLPHTALYGAGLLRMWCGAFYIRVYARVETEESKAAVWILGQALASDAAPVYPELLNRLPAQTAGGWRIRKDRVGYFRSHMVFNSLYYLSHSNILDLDHSVEAVFSPYESSGGKQAGKQLQVLLVNYTSAAQAQKAMAHFREAYLPEVFSTPRKSVEPSSPGTDGAHYYPIEDGWLGMCQSRSLLAIIFGAPSRAAVQETLAQILAYAAAKGE